MKLAEHSENFNKEIENIKMEIENIKTWNKKKYIRETQE